MNHRTLAALSLIALGAAACGNKTDAAAKLPPPSGPGAAPAPKLPALAVATATNAGAENHTTGTTFPHAESQLAPNVGGIISKIHVNEGTRVRRGEVLYSLDTRDSALRLEQAKIGLESAKVNLRAMEVEYNRNKALFDQNAINRAQWDQIEPRFDAAKIGVKQAELAVAMAQKALDDAIVRAPFDGVVTQKMKNEGEMATMMPPTVVVVVQDQSLLDLRFRLPERSLSTIKLGQTVKARFEAVGQEREAKITRIVPTVDARTRTMEVVAEIANKDLSLKPGLLARVEVTSP